MSSAGAAYDDSTRAMRVNIVSGSVGNSGNVTLNPSTNFIGIVTVANAQSGSVYSTQVYNSTATTYSSGASIILQADVNGNTLVSQGTKIAGEDLTNDWMKIQAGPYTYQGLYSLVTITPKSAAGVLHNVVVGGYSGPTINFWDNTAASGTLIGSLNANVPPGTYSFDIQFSTGLTVQPLPAGGILPNITVGYK